MYLVQQPRGVCLLANDLMVSENSLYFRHDAGLRLLILVSSLLMKSTQFVSHKLKHRRKSYSIGVIIDLIVTLCSKCCERGMASYIAQLHMPLMFSDTKARSGLQPRQLLNVGNSLGS